MARQPRLAGVMIALALCGCGDAPGEADQTNSDATLNPHPNVLLIVLDTVRADHLGCYGYELPTSPVLDALADQATLYTGARATAPWSLPSHASLFTGLYSFEHGAHTQWVDVPDRQATGADAVKPKDLPDNVSPLPYDRPTLAEELKLVGYNTAAIMANDVFLDAHYGLDRGFDLYEVNRTYADGVHQRVSSWLEQRDERPFFLFLNYMDAHVPYNPAPVARLNDNAIPDASGKVMGAIYSRLLSGETPPPTDLLDTLTAQYDRGIANLDAGLGQLFDTLKEQGLYDDLLLIITSDHGEFLGEHHLVAHSKDVYEPVMKIPLIIKQPGQQLGEVRDELVSLVHIPHLVFDHVDDVDKSAFPHEAGQDEMILGENYYTRWRDLLEPWGGRFERIRRVVYRGDLKYIDSSDGQNELYNLAADGGELSDMIEAQSATAGELADELRRWLEAPHAEQIPFEERIFSDEERERLEALGYL